MAGPCYKLKCKMENNDVFHFVCALIFLLLFRIIIHALIITWSVFSVRL